MRHLSFRRWTEREDVRLEELRLDGHSATAIARLMGRSVSSIKGRLKRIEAPKAQAAARHLEVLSMPHTVTEAMHLLGFSHRSGVRQARTRLRKMGFEVLEATVEPLWNTKRREHNGRFVKG